MSEFRVINIVVFVIMVIIINVLPADTYYVDANIGDDLNAGGVDFPFKTLAKAQLAASTGGTIILSEGVYVWETEVNTSRDDWLIVKNKEGCTPIIDSGVVAWRYPKIKTDYWIHLEGLTINDGISFSYSNHIVINDCHIVGDGFDFGEKSVGISIEGCSEVKIENCLIDGTGSGLGYNSTSGKNGQYYNTAFETGIIVKYIGGGTDNLLIDGCTIVGCGENISVHGNGMTISNNHIYYGSDDGIVLVDTNRSSELTTTLSNNLIHDMAKFNDNHIDFIQLNDKYGATDLVYRNLVIKNNICYNSDQQGFFLRANTSESENWLVENNLIYNTDLEAGGNGAVRVMSVNGLSFKNNTIVPGPEGDGSVIFENYSDNCNITDVSGNIVYRLDLGTQIGVNVIYEDYNIINYKGVRCKDHIWGTRTVILNDLDLFKNIFSSYDSMVYKLSPDSLGVDYLPLDNYAATDLLGNARADLVSIGNEGADYAEAGCYEYIPDVSTPSKPEYLIGSCIDEFTIELSWNSSKDAESGIKRYIVLRDNVQIATADSLEYTDTNLSPNTSYSYRIVAINGDYLESLPSDELIVSTIKDVVNPEIVTVEAESSTLVNIVFNEPMDEASVINGDNYSIYYINEIENNKKVYIAIDSIIYKAGSMEADITTSRHIEENYFININNLKDESDNVILPVQKQYSFTNVALFLPFDGTLENESDYDLNVYWSGTGIYDRGILNESVSTLNGSYPAVSHNDVLDGFDKFTISGWAKKTAPSSGGFFVNKHVTYHCQIGESSFIGYIYDIDGGRHNYAFSTGIIADTDWHHYVVEYDGSSIIGYVDSILVGSTPFSGQVVSNPSRNIYIGKDPWGDTFQGSIDELRIYNDALTEQEIVNLYNSPPPHITVEPQDNETVSENNVSLSWETDEDSTSSITYWPVSALKTSSVGVNKSSDNVSEAEYDQKHSVSLTGLLASTQYTYTITCTDKYGNSATYESDDYTFTTDAIIPINHAPEIKSITAVIVKEGETGTITPVFTDPDNDKLKFTYKVIDVYPEPVTLVNGDQLPALLNAELNEDTGVLTVKPDYKFTIEGKEDFVFTLLFTATDPGGLSDTYEITLTIKSNNQLPTAKAGDDQTVTTDKKNGKTGVTLDGSASSDVEDGTTLTYKWECTDEGSTLPEKSGVSASYENLTVGTYNFKLTVTDAEGGSATDTVVVTVKSPANKIPTWDQTVPDKTVKETETVNFSISATDQDEVDTVTYTATGLPNGAAFVGNTFNWETQYGDEKATAYPVVFTATDGEPGSAVSMTVNITVTDLNRAPVFDVVTPPAFTETQEQSFTISATDEDDDDLFYTCNDLPAGATLVKETGQFTWKPSYEAYTGNSVKVTFEVTDKKVATTVKLPVELTVIDKNRLPVYTNELAFSLESGTTLKFVASVSDPDGDSVEVKCVSKPANATFTENDDTFKWTPALGTDDSFQVVFTADDGKVDQPVEFTVNIAVGTSNHAPELYEIAKQYDYEGNLVTFTAKGKDDDGDTLTFALVGAPSGASIDPSSGNFTWNAGYDAAGVYDFTVTLSDGQITVSRPVNLTIDATNRTPLLSVSGSTNILYKEGLNLAVSASDPDNDSVSITVEGLPSGAVYSKSKGTITWATTVDSVGSYDIVIIATDGGLSAKRSLTIVVGGGPEDVEK